MGIENVVHTDTQGLLVPAPGRHMTLPVPRDQRENFQGPLEELSSGVHSGVVWHFQQGTLLAVAGKQDAEQVTE